MYTVIVNDQVSRLHTYINLFLLLLYLILKCKFFSYNSKNSKIILSET